MTPPDNGGTLVKLHDHKLETLETDVNDLRSVIRSELESVRGEIADSNTQIRALKNHEVKALQSDVETIRVDMGEVKGTVKVGVWFVGLVALINVALFLSIVLAR